jgi:hypothetical protein
MTSKQVSEILLILVLGFSRASFADSKTVESSNTSIACSGGPDCVVMAGLMLMMSGLDLKPATAEKMDSVPGSLIIFCEQSGAVPEMSFPCGPTELELFQGPQKQTLNFRGGKIVVPQLPSVSEASAIIRARGCKETQTLKEAKAGDVIRIRLSASCTKPSSDAPSPPAARLEGTPP